MKSRFFRSLSVLVVLAVASLVISAQQITQQNDAVKMFAGEKLVFEGKISRLKLSVTVAELTFEAAHNASDNELVIKTVAESKGTLLKLFRFSFLQNYESTIDPANNRILKTIKHDVQKERVRDSEALFDYTERRVTWFETDPKDENRPPRRIASEIAGPMHDMVSAIYAVRLQKDLAIGKRFELSVSDSGLTYKVPVVVTGRERLGTNIGKAWCWRIEPEVFGKGRLIEQKGRMIIWIFDDPTRVPVKARIDSQYGKIEIKIKSATTPKT
ncbi:MAG: DUF3108 domain-containing protein [Pyrinomonadaceae bacterium]